MNLALSDLDNAPRSGTLRRRLTCVSRLSTQCGRSHNTGTESK